MNIVKIIFLSRTLLNSIIGYIRRCSLTAASVETAVPVARPFNIERRVQLVFEIVVATGEGPAGSPPTSLISRAFLMGVARLITRPSWMAIASAMASPRAYRPGLEGPTGQSSSLSQRRGALGLVQQVPSTAGKPARFWGRNTIAAIVYSCYSV